MGINYSPYFGKVTPMNFIGVVSVEKHLSRFTSSPILENFSLMSLIILSGFYI